MWEMLPKTGFSDQESMEPFLKYPLSVIQKKDELCGRAGLQHR